MLKPFLKQLGLSEKEATVYLALLEIGANGAATVAKQTPLSRTTVYSLLESLEGKGYVQSYQKNKLRFFEAMHPAKISSQLDMKIRAANVQRREFGMLLPQFLQLMSGAIEQVKVQYFEGIDGVKAIYEDSLIGDHRLKLAFSSAPESGDPELQKFFKDYIKRRVAKNIRVRALFLDNAASQKAAARDEACLRESRLISAERFPLSNEVSIYGNKMSIMSLKDKNYHGVIIESADIANTQRSIFELAWIGAGV
jgi:sugar-specific transcriptional regulator TrmB